MHIKNFKAFADSGPISIRPITLFCGTNSCGKSSLLQSLLLWKQSIESRNSDQSILMNGRLIHLGTFINTIHGHDIQTPISFEFEYKFTSDELYRAQRSRFRYPWRSLLQDFVPGLDNVSRSGGVVYNVKYSVELGTSSASLESKAFKRSVVPRAIKLQSSALTPEGEEIKGSSVNLSQIRDSKEYEMQWENLRLRHRKGKKSSKSGNARIKRFIVDPINETMS
jgi:GTPase SAR1 family protein